MKINIKPLFDKVIVKDDLRSNKLENGLVLPTEAKDKPRTGIVISCGDNLVVKSGDKVMYGEYAGAKFKHEEEEYIIMRESDIFAIFN